MARLGSEHGEIVFSIDVPFCRSAHARRASRMQMSAAVRFVQANAGTVARRYNSRVAGRIMFPIQLVHPMIVHFPIVFLLTTLVVDFAAMARGSDLGGATLLSRVSAGALILAAGFGILAYLFGDIAYDRAIAAGFPETALEAHEGLGTATMAILVALALLRLVAQWRGIGLGGGRGWLITLGTLAATAVMLTTAYHGGQLVYELGVNVAAAKP
jgi:uncharacterized membrane protein